MKFPLISRKNHVKKLGRAQEKINSLAAEMKQLKEDRNSLRKGLKRLERFVAMPRPATQAKSEHLSNRDSPLEADPLAYLTNDEPGGLTFGKLSENIPDLLSIASIRHYIAQKRWTMFQQSGANLRIHSTGDPGIFEDTAEHNIKGITNSLSSVALLERSELVFRPVMALDRVYSYQARSVFPELSVLLVGSRTEYEVLLGMSYGIQPANLKAIDLLSYSPWIMTGDMHALPFEDNSFDVLILGWTLGYSRTPERVADEIVRVCKPGAVVSIGNDCYSREALQKSNFASDKRPQTVKDLLKCFGRHVGNVFFAHDPHYTRADIPGFTGHLISTFEIKK